MAGGFDQNSMGAYGGQQDVAPLYRGAPVGVIAEKPGLMRQNAFNNVAAA